MKIKVSVLLLLISFSCIAQNEKQSLDEIKNKLSQGINHDKDEIFSHFNLLVNGVGGSKYNKLCTEILIDLDLIKSKKDGERLPLFNQIAGFQIMMLPKKISESAKVALIKKLNNSFTYIEGICESNKALRFSDAFKLALVK